MKLLTITLESKKRFAFNGELLESSAELILNDGNSKRPIMRWDNPGDALIYLQEQSHWKKLADDVADGLLISPSYYTDVDLMHTWMTAKDFFAGEWEKVRHSTISTS